MSLAASEVRDMSRIKLCYKIYKNHKILLECYENCENNIVITSKSGEEMQMRPRKALDETGVKIKRRQVRRPSHMAYKKSLAELRYSESWETIHIFEMIKESHHVRKSETVLDYGFQVMDSGLQGVDSWFFVSGTWFGFQSLSASGFLELNSRLQSPGFWIQQAKISRIPDSFSKNLPDSGIHVSLHGAGRKSYKIDPLKYVM